MKFPEITNRGNFNKLQGPPCRFHRTSSLPIPKGYESFQRLRKLPKITKVGRAPWNTKRSVRLLFDAVHLFKTCGITHGAPIDTLVRLTRVYVVCPLP